MTTSKTAIIAIFFNIFSSNKGVDTETLMVAVNAIMTAHWIVWKDGGAANFEKTMRNELRYSEKRYLFSIIALASMDFDLFELKKRNNTLTTEEVY